jgi:dipeptidyl aminopeptidase/acylaminoacyl peptidase
LKPVVFAAALFWLGVGSGVLQLSADDSRSPLQKGKGFKGPTGVYRDRVTAHWFADDTKFWYRNDLKDKTKEFILVDADKGTRGPAFDHAKLATALSKAAGAEYKADRLPFDEIEFSDDARFVTVEANGKRWGCDTTTYVCTPIGPARKKNPPPDEEATPHRLATSPARGEVRRKALALFLTSPLAGEVAAERRVGGDSENHFPHPDEQPADSESPWVDDVRGEQPIAFLQPPKKDPDRARSPDGKWTAVVKEFNVYLRDADGNDTQLTKDGKDGFAYGRLNWSPDSKTLVAFRVEPGDRKEVYLIESSPPGGGRAVMTSRPYALPGDTFASYELHVFDIENKKELPVKEPKITLATNFDSPRLRWAKDGRTFSFQKTERGHQRFRLIEVDARTGKSRDLIDEKTDTFIWTAHTENVGVPIVSWLQKTDEIVYVSEKSGWRHLYLIDAKTGKETNAITSGEYVVRSVERIDEEKRQVWFRASGKNPDQDPYFVHSYRVNFDGTGLVALTEGNGTHTVAFSPNRKYLIDTYSRVDAPPVTELRRADDGKLVTKLEEADVTELKARGVAPMEVFTAKGRDGKTDIWGVITRPRNFDASKKYPVIESIYAGPQGSFVPKSFSAFNRYSALADLGFIVVQIDGMGTANRSKAFHDVCWKNLKDAGFPDRILWHKAVAAKYPYYDISRVGVYGTSAGGQNAMGALLFAGDFYKAAVAACGCHDNRMDKASWNEQWMGYPVGPQYAASSNVDNAKNLTGKLLLIVGEKDTNVPPESTMRVVDALIKAGKDFDLLVVPGMGHSNGGQYGTRRMNDFFVRHLQGVEPPDRNLGKK